MLKLTRLFSQIKRQQIINSTYDQLVQRIAHNYNLKEYKNQSGLCLLQMHHQFTLFKPGDWVLDIGSGKNYAWTDLALKLTQNQESTHRVISNDILDLRKNRQNNTFIKGDINEQPVQTKIALQLENHNLNTILVDISPPFTGNINGDGRKIMSSITSVMNLAQNFLNKGGNMVCKVLQSQAQPLLNENFDIYFNEKYRYLPSIMRKTSPVCFYVLKGFLMSENLYALDDFFKNYKGSPDKKIKLVQKYRGKYSWDPEKIIKKQILEDILRMRKQGRPDKDIIKTFANDPYAKAQRILKLLQQAEQAQKDRNMVLHYKIMNQISQGQLYKNAQQMPSTAQQFYQKVVDDMQKMIKEDKQKKEERKNKISRSPLKENQVYMKAEDEVKQRQKIEKQYFKGDLEGNYSGRQSPQQIQEQITKIQKIHPQVRRLMSEIQEASKETSQKTIEQILQENKHRQQQLSAESLRNIQQTIEQSIKNMSSSQIQEERRLERDVYRRELHDEREQKADRWVNQRRSRRKKPLF